MKRAIKFIEQYGALEPNSCFSYVTIHPFSDDEAAHARLGVAENSGKLVDGYWAVEGTIYFVSVHASPRTSETYSCSPRKDPTVPYDFYVRIDNPVVTKPALERVLEQLSPWLDTNRHSMPQTTVRLFEPPP